MRIYFHLLLLSVLVSHILGESVPTFCKCTCFTNSTIVRLGPQDSTEKTSGNALLTAKRAASTSCTQCTRAFCLNYNLPICKGAEEKDVVTMCFQRDSRKDMVIVWAFILGTIGLLGWAAAKRVADLRKWKSLLPGGGLPHSISAGGPQDRGDYAPVNDSGR